MLSHRDRSRPRRSAGGRAASRAASKPYGCVLRPRPARCPPPVPWGPDRKRGRRSPRGAAGRGWPAGSGGAARPRSPGTRSARRIGRVRTMASPQPVPTRMRRTRWAAGSRRPAGGRRWSAGGLWWTARLRPRCARAPGPWSWGARGRSRRPGGAVGDQRGRLAARQRHRAARTRGPDVGIGLGHLVGGLLMLVAVGIAAEAVVGVAPAGVVPFTAQVAGAEDAAALALGVVDVGHSVEYRVEYGVEVGPEVERCDRGFEFDGSVQSARIHEAGGDRARPVDPATPVPSDVHGSATPSLRFLSLRGLHCWACRCRSPSRRGGRGGIRCRASPRRR